MPVNVFSAATVGPTDAIITTAATTGSLIVPAERPPCLVGLSNRGPEPGASWKVKGGPMLNGMDKMIGPDFEKGLAQLKVVAESAVRK